MLSAGATIEDFSILRAHVIASGGNYSKAGELWLHANGACLPVICLIVYLLLFYKKDHMTPFYHFFSYVVALFPIGSTLAWVIIPFLYINGKSTIPKRQMGIRFGLSFGCMYLVGMQEVVVSASPCDTYGTDFERAVSKNVSKRWTGYTGYNNWLYGNKIFFEE